MCACVCMCVCAHAHLPPQVDPETGSPFQPPFIARSVQDPIRPPLTWFITRVCPPQVDPETDRPFEPPVIKDVEVLWNPFEDIVPRFNKKLEQKMAREKAE